MLFFYSDILRCLGQRCQWGLKKLTNGKDRGVMRLNSGLFILIPISVVVLLLYYSIISYLCTLLDPPPSYPTTDTYVLRLECAGLET